MRYVLTPTSALTWANLNHTLCGLDNDPWRDHFDMGKWHFLWADFYLLMASLTANTLNTTIGLTLFG